MISWYFQIKDVLTIGSRDIFTMEGGIQCAVCHVAMEKTRVHYGGVSCYSCRAFFRRTTQREELAKCKFQVKFPSGQGLVYLQNVAPEKEHKEHGRVVSIEV